MSVVWLVVLCSWQVRDAAPQLMSGTAIVEGTVVSDDASRTPLGGVTLRLVRAGVEDIRLTSTDRQGRYQFRELAAGTYTMTASKGAYITTALGAPRPGLPGTVISLQDGDRYIAEALVLMRGAVIAGRVLARSGRGVVAQVQATQIVLFNGERRKRTGLGASATVTSNAHGEYRIYGLLPGEYVVQATSQLRAAIRDSVTKDAGTTARGATEASTAGSSFVYSPTWYPGTDESRAGPISLARSEERAGIDIPLRHLPVARITGRVTTVDGQPAESVTIVAVPAGSASPGSSGAAARSGRDGAFVLPAMPAGDFALIASLMTAGSAGRLSGRTDITITGNDLHDTALQIGPGHSMSGRILFDSTGRAPLPLGGRTVQLRLVPLDAPGAPLTDFANDGTRFSLTGVLRGRYRLEITIAALAREQWRVRSAMHGGRDLLDAPVEIADDFDDVVVTLTDRKAGISGTLTDGAGRPAQYYVLAFPVQDGFWTENSRRVGFARADVHGAYAISDLPAGEYYLCALTELDVALQYEPGYLQQFIPASIKVTVTDQAPRIQHLRVGR